MSKTHNLKKHMSETPKFKWELAIMGLIYGFFNWQFHQMFSIKEGMRQMWSEFGHRHIYTHIIVKRILTCCFGYQVLQNECLKWNVPRIRIFMKTSVIANSFLWKLEQNPNSYYSYKQFEQIITQNTTLNLLTACR